MQLNITTNILRVPITASHHSCTRAHYGALTVSPPRKSCTSRGRRIRIMYTLRESQHDFALLLCLASQFTHGYIQLSIIIQQASVQSIILLIISIIKYVHYMHINIYILLIH
ncbi:hypothetical protein NP493_1051g00058 [Ridgeia piscesae]|uniref:Uncharacterized protein n=1 Tax=Ridgeia piscesae TaxID=27915 RepID=A0AAD9KI39_RIDPI|nr:hypothetical protein NP493_1051g00058 [Ridgeia piscesae]